MRGLLFILIVAAIGLMPSRSTGADPSPREQGRAMLQAGNTADAMAEFTRAISMDARDFHAMHGLALCHYAENDAETAVQTLREAMRISGNAADSSLVINLASLELKLGNAMAAATHCAEHLKRQEDTAEEAVLNALGVALVAAQRDHANTPEFTTAAAIFARTTARLEAAQPGMKRWGTEWVPVDEYDERLAEGPPIYPHVIEMSPLGEPPAVVANSGDNAGGHVAALQPAGKRAKAPERAKPRAAIAIPIGPDLLLAPADVVAGARNVQLESTQGLSMKATVVRVDEGAKLALLKVEGRRLAYLNLADQLEDGPVQLAAVIKPVVFNLVPEIIDGNVRRTDRHWMVQLQQSPHLGGSPVTRDGRIVGIALHDPAGEQNSVQIVSVNAIRAFLGSDLPRPARMNADPRSSIYQVTADK